MQPCSDIPPLVPAELGVDFRKFVDTGEASPEFLQRLDSDKGLQVAVDQAFRRQAQSFKEVAMSMKADPATTGDDAGVVTATSGSLTAVALQAARLPPEQREAIATRTVESLQKVLEQQPEDLANVQSLVSRLRSALG